MVRIPPANRIENIWERLGVQRQLDIQATAGVPINHIKVGTPFGALSPSARRLVKKWYST